MLNQQQLMPGLLHIRYILKTFGSSSGYPPDFLIWISQRYCRHLLTSAQVSAVLYDLKCTTPYLPLRS